MAEQDGEKSAIHQTKIRTQKKLPRGRNYCPRKKKARENLLIKREPATKEQESFVERLAQTLGVATNATHIFAPPIQREGVTVIPVAKAKYGFGGGSGQQRGEAGSGGGGGAVITPAGYIEITNGSTRYHPIRDPLAMLAVAVAGGLAALLVVRSIFKPVRQTRSEE